MFGIHPDLRRHVAVTWLSSAALGIAGLAMLAALAAGAPALRPIPTWLIVIFVIMALAIGYFGAIVAPRRYRAASHVVSSVGPVPDSMTLRLDSSSDSTSLYGRLEAVEGAGVFQPREIPLLIPRWDIAPLLKTKTPVSVYIDPQTSDIVAFGTAAGLLWCLPRPFRNA